MDLMSPLAAPFNLEGGPDGVLLLHGFTGTPANLRPMGEALHAAGYSVRCILLAGHGTRMEDMAKGNAEIWKAQAREAYRQMRETCRTVSVMGLSMGGLLTLILAGESPAPDCVVSMAAALKITTPFSALAPVLGVFVPVVGEGFRLDRGPDFLKEYDIGYSGTPLGSVPQLRRLMQDARAALPAITCPILIAQSTGDPSVRPVSAQIIYDQVASPQKELMWLKAPGHVVPLGPDRQAVFDAAIALLNQVTVRP